MRIACIAALVLFATACTKGSGPAGAVAADDFAHADALEPAEQACSRDVECVLVDDCCGCSRGGLRMSVRTDAREAVTDRSESVCAQRTCSELQSRHRSCAATAARCLGGRCVPAL